MIPFPNSAKVIQAASVLLIAISIQAKSNPSETAPFNGTRPLNFEANQGQAAADVRFLLRGSRYTLLLSERNARLSFSQQSTRSSLQMTFVGARTPDAITGDNPLPGKVNYLIGNDPKRWHQSVPTFAKVHYRNLYNGIDLTFYGNQQQLEYDFTIAPGADLRTIKLAFSAPSQALSTDFDKNGDLLCRLPNREFRLRKPIFYQAARNAGSPRESVDGQFTKLPSGEIGFAVGAYDRARPLIIDPVVEYSSYLGGSDDEGIFAIQRDTAGNLYMTGEVSSVDFPIAGPVQAKVGGDYDAFVSKFDPSGTQLIYSTYLGGSKYENGSDLAVDSEGSAYIAGETASDDFPIFQALQPSFGGMYDAFVARLDPSGSQLIFSTYLGGAGFDTAEGIALGPDNAVYVAGTSRSINFPITDGAYQTTCDRRANAPVCSGDGFVTKMDSAGSTLIYSTYLGGSGSDSAYGIAVDPHGTAYISGSTASSDFPAFRPYQARKTGSNDAFLTRLSPDGKSLIFSTYFGGSGFTSSHGLALDRFHNSYVIGNTNSSDLPTVSPFQSQLRGSYDGFIAKFDAKGQVVYASYLGGSNTDFPFRVAVDAAGSAAVAGFTQSSDFPILNAVQPNFGGGSQDVFVTKVSPDGSTLLYSTYLGGTGDDYAYAVYSDEAGNVWVGGSTTSHDFFTVNAFQGSFAGGPFDAFFTKLSADSIQSVQ